jgi:hypothetical protein
MNLSTIINECYGMQIRIVNLGFPLIDLEDSFPSIGFTGDPNGLRECSKEHAITIIKNMIWKDMAFNSENVTESTALQRAQFIIEQFYISEMKFYTNGDWAKGFEGGNGWCSMLDDFTYDGGVVCVSNAGNVTICSVIWFIAED